MEKNFEKRGKEALIGGKREAFQKIEMLLKPNKFHDNFNYIAKLLFPEILSEKRKELEEKWKDADIQSSDFWDKPESKEYTQDYDQFNKELGEFIKLKSAEEIYQGAEEMFRGRLNDGGIAMSVDRIIKEYHLAYEIAKLFLTKQLMKEAAESCRNTLIKRLKEIGPKDPRHASLIKELLFFENWFQGVNIRLLPEQAGMVLGYLASEESLDDHQRQELFRSWVTIRGIKTKDSEGRKTTKEIIVNKDSLRQGARKEIKALLAAKEKEKALKAANFFEKKGIMDLDKDADLFDELTKSK